MKKRVVVTGMGIVSPVGNDVPAFWESITAGKSGAAPITLFDPADFSTRFACEVKNFELGDILDPKDARRFQRFVLFGLSATQQALEDAKLLKNGEVLDKENVGVIVGSGIGGIQIFEEQTKIFIERGPRRISPFFVPMMISDIVAGQISITYGLSGPNFAVVSACATAGHALHVAKRLIQSGEADVVVSGGSEGAISHLSVGGFGSMKALSTRNDDPAHASRPFDKDRDGFVIGEGAGILILEEYEHAKARGATIHAELIGVGASGDAYHITAPHVDGAGAIRAMKAAMKDAEISVSDINYINAHGTATPPGDAAESRAIHATFKEHTKNLAVSSTKSMTGHCLGAAGSVEAIVSILALKNNILPPTINLDNLDPECDLFVVPNKKVERKIDIVMSNAFGFGGHNSSLIFARHGLKD
ncbi:beta-ketoacyl-[acyl-carrier-protein] synthase II [bacterium]|nr:MAG: beta-ketoacyl-[acyl-carrier-protein] synthase II [bacterium]